MRPFKKTKPKNPTILQQQSNKLKQKLQLLKQQVSIKKQQKQMSKTASSLNGNKNQISKQGRISNRNLLTTTTKNNQYDSVDIKYQNALIEMKIENIQQKLKQKGIKSYQKLMSLSQQQIDEWKDILVGYRIKLKKFIKTNAKVYNIKSQQAFDSIQITESKQQFKQSFDHRDQKYSDDFLQIVKQQVQNKKQSNSQKNIQDIIKQREKVKTFVPLMRESQQIDEDQYDNQYRNLMDEDEDVIIQSFMKVFHPRKGILKQSKQKIQGDTGKTLNAQNCLKGDKNKNKKVHWSTEVEKMQKQFARKNHKKYPKQAIKKQALNGLNMKFLIEQQNDGCNQNKVNLVKYCWHCFRKIDLKDNINFRKEQQNQAIHYFCSQKCQTIYKEQVNIFAQNIKPQKLCEWQEQQTNQKQNGNKNSFRQNEQNYIDQDQDGLEYVDLSIL